MSIAFRHSAGFGKRVEYWIVGLMLKQGLDVYLPLVDDNGVDAVIKRPDGSFIEVQIKARSATAKLGDGALFAAITHELRSHYWFVMYSERLDIIWVMSSEEFIAEAVQNKTGINVGKQSLWFSGTKMNQATGVREEYMHERYKKYVSHDFARLLTTEKINGRCRRSHLPCWERIKERIQMMTSTPCKTGIVSSLMTSGYFLTPTISQTCINTSGFAPTSRQACMNPLSNQNP